MSRSRADLKLAELVEKFIADFDQGKLTYKVKAIGATTACTVEESHAFIRLFVREARRHLTNIACAETEERVRAEYAEDPS